MFLVVQCKRKIARYHIHAFNIYDKPYKTKILLIYFEKECIFVNKVIYVQKIENYLFNCTNKYFHKIYLFNVNLMTNDFYEDISIILFHES